MTLGFLGPAFTFSERAAAVLGGGRALVPLPDIAALFAALVDGTVERIIVPLENSEAGPVPATLAALCALDAPLAVLGDLRLPVRFALYRRAGDTAPLARVFGHAMSLAQCAPWIAARGVATRAVGSNGAGFVAVRDGDASGEGALAHMGIEAPGIVAVDADVQGARAFETRFVLLGHDHASGPVARALIILLETPDNAIGIMRHLASRDDGAVGKFYELAPKPPVSPRRLPGRPLLLWRARA